MDAAHWEGPAAGARRNGDGRCDGVYEQILTYQGVSSPMFRHWIYEALRHGRRKGNAVMVVGGRDTGKTTVTQPAAMIYRTMECPQSDSFCPLESIRGHELILWHDFRYSPGHPRKEEQGMRLDEGTFNRLLEGLPTRIGVPKSDGTRRDFVYDESAAFIFTGPFSLTAYRNGAPDAKETEQLACRVRYVHFSRLAPPADAVRRDFKACPVCWARWILSGELDWRAQEGHNIDELTAVPAAVHARTAWQTAASSSSTAPAPGASVVDHLRELIVWRTQGHISEAEFESAKRALGLG